MYIAVIAEALLRSVFRSGRHTRAAKHGGIDLFCSVSPQSNTVSIYRVQGKGASNSFSRVRLLGNIGCQLALKAHVEKIKGSSFIHLYGAYVYCTS